MAELQVLRLTDLNFYHYTIKEFSGPDPISMTPEEIGELVYTRNGTEEYSKNNYDVLLEANDFITVAFKNKNSGVLFSTYYTDIYIGNVDGLPIGRFGSGPESVRENLEKQINTNFNTNFKYNFTNETSVFIPHNFNREVITQVYVADGEYHQLIDTCISQDKNSVTVKFSEPLTGFIILI